MDQNHDDQDTRPVESTETDATETVPETTTEVPVNATTEETTATEETAAAAEAPPAEETPATEETPAEETPETEETEATEETTAAEETAAETAADEGRDANTEAAEGGEAGASNSEWELVEAVDANEEDVEKSSQSAVVVDAVVEEELADYDTDVEEAEEVDEPIAPQPTKVPAIDDSAAVTAEPQFDEDELAAMEADSAAVEAASHDTEKATRARIATLRKSYFTARALKRQANARVAEAIDAAAKEPEGEITAEPYGPKSDIIDQLKEKAVALETEASKLEADIANHENAQKRLGPQYLGAIKALFMLDRFEQFLVNLSEHVKAQNANADKPQGEEVEAKVLEHVRELVTKRNKEVERLETIKERVRKTAADLRRGQVITRASKTPSLGGNPTQQSGSPTIGRSSVAREDDSAIANASEEVSELRGYNELVGKEVEDLTDALLRLTKEKSALSVKLTTTKASLRKAEMRLNDELKQKSLRLRADTKAIEELHRTNAGLISTIETLMHQLNNEYYGAGERPNALSPSSKKAIAAKGATSSTAATSVAASPAASPEEEDVEEETNVNEEEAVATGENEAEATEEHEAAAPADEVAVAEEATA